MQYIHIHTIHTHTYTYIHIHTIHTHTYKILKTYMCMYSKSIYIHIWISNSHTGTYELAGSLMKVGFPGLHVIGKQVVKSDFL